MKLPSRGSLAPVQTSAKKHVTCRCLVPRECRGSGRVVPHVIHLQMKLPRGSRGKRDSRWRFRRQADIRENGRVSPREFVLRVKLPAGMNGMDDGEIGADDGGSEDNIGYEENEGIDDDRRASTVLQLRNKGRKRRRRENTRRYSRGDEERGSFGATRED